MDAELKLVLTEFKDEIKKEIKDVRSEIADLRGELTGVKGEVADLRGELSSVESRLSKRMDCVEGEVKELRLVLENEIRPDIRKIAEGYTLLEERLDRSDEEEKQYRKSIELRIGALVNQKAN